jgi:hypothetical protein
MSDDAIAWAPAQDTGSPRIKSLLIALAPFVQADGTVWARIDVLALKMDCADRTVQRSIRAALEAKWLKETGRQHLYEGKLHPLYSVPLERGPSCMRERLELEKARAWGDKLSPQDEAGCQNVTPTGDKLSPLGVTECHPAILRESKRDEEKECVSARGAFDRLVDVWKSHKSGKGRVDEPKAWTAFVAAIAAGLDPEALLGMATRFLAESRDAKAGRVPMLDRWIAGKRWLGWEAKPAASAPAPFAGPDELMAAVRRRFDDAWIAAWLGRCVWIDADRAIAAPLQFVADRLRADLRRELEALGVVVTVTNGRKT